MKNLIINYIKWIIIFILAVLLFEVLFDLEYYKTLTILILGINLNKYIQ